MAAVTATPPKKAKPQPASPALKANGAVKADDKAVFNPKTTPIKFYDEEVARMHKQLATRSNSTKVTKPARPSSLFTLRGFVARVLVFYLLLAYFIVCPQDPTRSRAVCRSLDGFKERLASYEPYTRPYFDVAQKKLDPYVQKAKPYYNKAKPYYDKVNSSVRPFASQASDKYHSHVHPTLLKGVHASQDFTRPYVELAQENYKASVAPSVNWYSKQSKKWYKTNAEPHISFVQSKAKDLSQQAYDTVGPMYEKAYPMAHKHFHGTFLPFAHSSAKATREGYVNEVHPRLLTGMEHSRRFYANKVFPALQRFYSLYIAPQVDKIKAKIHEYQTKSTETNIAADADRFEKNIVYEHDANDLEDFIAELRDDVDDSKAPSDQSPEVPPEEQAAQTAEKRKVLESLQEKYEQSIEETGQAEYDLLVKMLYEIRKKAGDDIPDRFTYVIDRLEGESDKMIGKLSRHFQKSYKDDKRTDEEKVQEANVIGRNAVARIQKLANDAFQEVDGYRAAQSTKEVTALEAAYEPLHKIVDHAQTELGYGWSWLNDVNAADWDRLNKLKASDEGWRKRYLALLDGTDKPGKLARVRDPYADLGLVKGDLDAVVDSFQSILSDIKVQGQKEIKGEWMGVKHEARKALQGTNNMVGGVVGGAAAAAAAVSSSIASVAGATPTPSSWQGSVSSMVSLASASVSSVAAGAYGSIPPVDVSGTAQSVYENAKDAAGYYYGEASQSVVSAAGYEPSPTNARQRASSIAKAYYSSVPGVNVGGSVKDTYASAVSAAGSAYGEASQSVVRAAGYEHSPTDLRQSVTAVVNAYYSSVPEVNIADKVKEGYNSASDAAASFYGEASKSVVSAAGSEPSPSDIRHSASSLAKAAYSAVPGVKVGDSVRNAYGSVADAAASFYGEASQSIIRTAGGEPSPTDLRQSATSLAKAAYSSIPEVNIGDSAQHVADAAGSLYNEASQSASSATDAAYSSASKVQSVISSYASPHPAYAKSTGYAAAVSSKVAEVSSDLSSRLHDATRTTAEGVQESASSLDNKASAAVRRAEL